MSKQTCSIAKSMKGVQQTMVKNYILVKVLSTVAFNDGIIVEFHLVVHSNLPNLNYRPTFSSHTVLPCSLPCSCILFSPATPSSIVDVSPLECVYGRGEGGVGWCDGEKSMV